VRDRSARGAPEIRGVPSCSVHGTALHEARLDPEFRTTTAEGRPSERDTRSTRAMGGRAHAWIVCRTVHRSGTRHRFVADCRDAAARESCLTPHTRNGGTSSEFSTRRASQRPRASTDVSGSRKRFRAVRGRTAEGSASRGSGSMAGTDPCYIAPPDFARS
jgi:hypothetical protein